MLHAVLLLDACLEGTLVGKVTGVTVVLEDAELVARHGDALEAQDLDRVGGTGGLDGVALGVEHGTHAAVGHAGDNGVTHVERAARHEHRSHRAAAAIELGLEDVARGEGVGVGLELEDIGLE